MECLYVLSVSVPLRGIGSEKLSLERRDRVVNSRIVSVPLRGIGSEKQLVKEFKDYKKEQSKFPSPCGE